MANCNHSILLGNQKYLGIATRKEEGEIAESGIWPGHFESGKGVAKEGGIMNKQVTNERIWITAKYEKEVAIVEVIRTTLLRRGAGTNKDPIRRIEQYWSLDGELLWEKDPHKEQK